MDVIGTFVVASDITLELKPIDNYLIPHLGASASTGTARVADVPTLT